MKHRVPRRLGFPLWGALLLAAAPVAQEEQTGPGPVGVDVFHPDVRAGLPQPAPAYGGRIIVHLKTMPKALNPVIDNSAVVTELQHELSDTLLLRDWERWDYVPRLAERYDLEDTLILNADAADKYGAVVKTIGTGETRRDVLFGKVTAVGDDWRVTSGSARNPLEGEVAVAGADVAAVERGTVYTVFLRAGVKWQDGHVFDAADVLFSWDVFNNPDVDCDDSRSTYNKILHGEVLDGLAVRFFYENQYFRALETVAGMPILPRHLFDLTDPDLKEHHPEVFEALESEHGAGYEVTLADRGEWVNENPHNQEGWIGLGPYRVTAWNQQHIEAERFEDYWDADSAKYGGYFDTIRWRHINDDHTAFQAMLNGELDLFLRIRSEQYFGAETETEQFRENLYKGYFYTGGWGYTGWNFLRPQFADQRVRRALAHAFDLENYLQTTLRGLAKQVTGPQNYFGIGYNHRVEPFAYDPNLAGELLAEAGWYDRDGDKIIDKDGIAFEFEFLHPSGNVASRKFGLKLQEALAPLGIRMTLANLEWATFMDRVLNRDFDAVNLIWMSPPESDPEQLWHSRWGKPGLRSSNRAPVTDPEVDRLIEAGQKELDPAKRAKIWHELHAVLYDLQPYLFMYNYPRKFAMNKRIRGLQAFKIAPGYSLRRLYFPEGTPGTHATRGDRP